MTDKLKDLVDRATICVEEVYDFYTNDDAGEHLGDVTIDDAGHCYGVSLCADHGKIERLLEARAKRIRAARDARCAKLEAALTDMVRQFAGWSEANGGCYSTDGLSALEEAFECLGYGDLMPAPEARCDEPGCTKQATCHSPSPSGYRHTCRDHMPKAEGSR